MGPGIMDNPRREKLFEFPVWGLDLVNYRGEERTKNESNVPPPGKNSSAEVRTVFKATESYPGIRSWPEDPAWLRQTRIWFRCGRSWSSTIPNTTGKDIEEDRERCAKRVDLFAIM